MQAFYHSVRPAVATATMRPCAPATSGAFGGLAASSSSSTFQFHRRRTFSTATGGAAFEVEIHGRQLLVDEHRLENTLARLTSRTASSSTSTSLTSNSTASASSSHLPTSAVNRTTTTRSANYTATTSTTVTSSSHPPPTSSASPRDTRPRALPGLEHRGLTSYPATSDILRDLALGSCGKSTVTGILPREDATFQISHDFYTEEERVEKVQSQKKSLVAMNQLEMYNAGGTHHPGGCLLQITQTGEVVERDETDLSIPRHVRLALHKRPINPVHERITYHERNYPDCPKTGRKSWARRWHEHAIVRHWGGLYMFCFFFSLATIVKFSLQSQEDITFITDPRRRTSGYYYLHQEDLDRM